MPNSTCAADDPPFPGLTCEPMELGDLDAIVEIEQASYPTPWRRSHFVTELDNSLAVNRVVRNAGKTIAYASTWWVERECSIHNITVAPGFRRRRIGGWLLARLLGEAARAHCRTATLEVRASNVAARRLYESHGFAEVGRRKGYYPPDNEDAVLMTAELSAADPPAVI